MEIRTSNNIEDFRQERLKGSPLRTKSPLGDYQ